MATLLKKIFLAECDASVHSNSDNYTALSDYFSVAGNWVTMCTEPETNLM